MGVDHGISQRNVFFIDPFNVDLQMGRMLQP